MQLIQPKLAKTMQKPPRTASQALRPPSGGGEGFDICRSAGEVVVDFSGSGLVLVMSGPMDAGAEDSVRDFDIVAGEVLNVLRCNVGVT
jgi:hypothetical protein